jgi:N-acetylglucosaminyldiphosphoundecaprenol N-acetyl-beta-D-mannosaminyltransferase
MMTAEPERVNVLGVGVSPVNMTAALDQVAAWIDSGQRSYVSFCTVNTIMECRKSEELRRVVNRAGMVAPDGMPLVWLCRRDNPETSRVYGPDFMLAEFERSVATGHRHFLYGGGPDVATRLASRMQARYPGLQIVGTLEPPFAPLDELCTPEAADLINASGADVVWVGISSPKQERWMARMRPLLNAPVLLAVGAAFDFHSGSVRQAPLVMQRSGLEWLFRLAMEPRRLWRRYLVYNSWFLYEIALQRLGLKRNDISR